MEFLNLDKVPEEPREKIKKFLTAFTQSYPKRIDCVVLYGSLISGGYQRGKSDLNLALVVESLSLEDLEPLVKILPKFLRQRIAIPLLFTWDYIQKSLDSFPMEFLEIKENHLLLYGKDVFSDIGPINMEHLRLQVEQLLKGRLLRIRQWYLEKGSRRGELKLILEFGIKDIFPALRNFLRLKGIQPLPVKKNEVVKELEQILKMDLGFLLKIINSDYKTRDLELYLNALIQLLEKLSLLIDEI